MLLKICNAIMTRKYDVDFNSWGSDFTATSYKFAQDCNFHVMFLIIINMTNKLIQKRIALLEVMNLILENAVDRTDKTHL